MTFTRRLLALFCAVVMMFSLYLPAQAQEEHTAYELIQQMLNFYRHHECAAKTDILYLVAQLEAIDPEAGASWRSIMEHWLYANSEMPRNETTLPDDLPQDDTLCIVVLGYRLDAYGGMSSELEGRLAVALDAAQQYPNAWIVCTGGGTASEAPDATEAGQMARWLKKQGIDSNRIIVEKASTHTIQNATFTFDIFARKYPQIRQLVLVTSDYHLPRSSTLFHAKSVLTPVEEGTDPFRLVACLGYDAGHEGTSEDPLDQAAHLARVCGFEYERADAPTLTKLTDLIVTCEEELELGQMPTITATAYYDNGFSRDVSELCIVEDYDPDKDRSQEMSVTYAENDRKISLSRIIRRPVKETEPAPTQVEAATEPTIPETVNAPAVPWVPFGILGLLALLLVAVLVLKKKR